MHLSASILGVHTIVFCSPGAELQAALRYLICLPGLLHQLRVLLTLSHPASPLNYFFLCDLMPTPFSLPIMAFTYSLLALDIVGC